jgi:sulfoxide reductase heme-binding subunit YedZ
MTARAAWLKPAAFAAACVPGVKVAVDLALGRLGANPVERGLNHLGYWALFFVALALLPTPLHALLGWRWPQRLRRMLGLFAFAYATLHVLWYAGVDKTFDVADIVADVTRRRFQAAGAIAWLCLAPLALTSTDRAVRRLGFARWKRLHRLAYVAAVLGVVHFWWRVKADLRSPAIFAAAIATLFAARLVPAARRAPRAKAQGVSA